MKGMVGAAAFLLLVAVGNGVLAAVPAGGAGIPADGSADGHSRLVDALARDHPVRIVSSSLAIVPPDPSGTLLAFATGAPTAKERDALAAFVAAGGLLVIAGDGVGVRAWVEPFGAAPLGLAAGTRGAIPCTPANLTWGTTRAEACLPSPSAFPQTALAANHTHLGLASVPLLFDLNGDGRLDLDDQAPDAYPLALGWQAGAGTVVAIADGDLWRNGAVAQWPRNLALAQSLAADRPGTVYVDATGAAPDQADALRDRFERSAAALTPAFPVLAGLAAAAAGLLALAPRLRPWRRHDPPPQASDPALEAELARTVQSFFREPT